MTDELVTQSSGETDADGKKWRRRGLLAAAWAAVTAIVLKETTQPVEAGVFNLQFIAGDGSGSNITNIASSAVSIINQLPFGTATGPNVLRVQAFGSSLDAIVGEAGSTGRNGVVGIAATGIG